MTPLDQAHAAMQAAPEDDAARLRFYQQLADAELFLLLREEPQGDDLSPRLLTLKEGAFVLAFDSEERLAEVTGAPAAYAALPGRVIAAQLAGQGVGIGLNLGVAPSSFLLPPDAVAWLAETLGHGPTVTQARPVGFHPPGGLPDRLVAALNAKLARAGGLAQGALLAGVRYGDGRRGHVLAFVGTAPGAEEALARAVAEALTFSGIEAGEMDVTHLAPDAPSLPALARVALPLDLPAPGLPAPPTQPPPGMDPDRPPRLK
jgi:hypothetical protein